MDKIVRLEGVIRKYKTLLAKQGDKIAMFTLESNDCDYELTVFQDVYREFESFLGEGGKVVIYGYWHNLLAPPVQKVFVIKKYSSDKGVT